MRKKILIIFLSFSFGISHAQEWFTNIDVAGRMALIQNKMLFVVWEESFNGLIPVLIKSDAGNTIIIDLAKDTRLDSIIKEYFVPVKLPEANFEDFIKAAKGRPYSYITKLSDNSIKIMDINGNIINRELSIDMVNNFSELIENYALNTAFLTMELRNYSDDKSYLTAYLLGAKYIEYAIYAKKDLREDIISLANIYLDEAETFVFNSTLDNSEAILQKIELMRIEQYLILNREAKARRKLNRIDADEVSLINERQYAFLQYTILMLREDFEEADTWKSEISSVDLKKAEMIMNIHKYGNTN